MDVELYLQRINYRGSLVPNLDTLRSLHRAHMFSVPFENLDMHLGRTIVLDEELFYEKIVGRKRGGFCYELNGLFAALLRDIGYDVTTLSARVADGDSLGPDFDHMCLLVQFEARWLVDVGFGESFVEPLLLDSTDVQVQRSVAYRIDNDGGNWTLWRKKDGQGEERQYVFTTQPRQLADFSAMCHIQQTSPQSHFTQKRICSVATTKGRISLSDDKLIISSDHERQERDLSANEYTSALATHFGMDLHLARTLR